MATHRKTEKERQLADERRGGGGGVGKEQNHTTTNEKAWSSIDYSIFSGRARPETSVARSLQAFTAGFTSDSVSTVPIVGTEGPRPS
jgi:hypothetical protein